MKRILLLAAAFFTLAVTGAFAQCPPDEFGVEAVCLPLPATAEAHWQAESRVIKLSAHCYAVIHYCRQWVCRGVPGLSRSRISISRVEFFNDLGGGGTGTGVGCPSGVIDPSSPTFQQDIHDLMTLIISKGIEQDIWYNDGRPRPCAEDPQDMLFEVVRGICLAQATWQGTIFHPASGGPKHFTGVVLSFCQTELACQNRYRACTDKFNNVITTLVDTKVIDANGAVINPPYPACTPSFDLPTTGGKVYEGVGNPIYGGVEGIDYILNIYNVSPVYTCTFSCGE